jgi:hypothetical protein
MALVLFELHAKEYYCQYKKREHQLSPDCPMDKFALRRPHIQMFSDFADKEKYDGRVPDGQYLINVYVKFEELISNHLDNEVKKRGGSHLHWDASYKEAKHLCRYNGKSIFRALITATNEVGEVRIQFHVVTDGHDQMKTPIREFLITMNVYGQRDVELLATDNPAGDCDFFLREIPSLQTNQICLNQMRSSIPTAVGETLVPTCVVESSRIKACRSLTEINTHVDAARNSVKCLLQNQRVKSLNAEWDVEKTLMGMIMGQGCVAVVQLSYKMEPEGHVHALVIQLFGREFPS